MHQRRHCEERSDDAIQTAFLALDYFAALAMTDHSERSSELLDEARVIQILDVRDLLDDADFEQEIGGFLVERLEFGLEELLAGGLGLPAQIFGGVAELLAAL